LGLDTFRVYTFRRISVSRADKLVNSPDLDGVVVSVASSHELHQGG